LFYTDRRYGGQPSTDHHYRSRDDRSDRREESRKKDSSSGGSNRHAHTSYDSNKSCKFLNQFIIYFHIKITPFVSAYGMSRNSESNAWSSTPVKSSYGTLSSSSGTNNMVINSRPDPWSNSNNSREIETTVWQRPPQPPPEKYIIHFLNICLSNLFKTILLLVLADGIVILQVILHLCQ